MPAIQFETRLTNAGSWVILRLPKTASAKLPSRGMAFVEGTINGRPLKTPLEPDGDWGHWTKLEPETLKTLGLKAGDSVKISIEPVKDWPDPQVPADIKKALAGRPEAGQLWDKITPMARWEWVRWVRSTANPQTRQHRIEVACSKMEQGKRRPCCWNRNLSTEPSVSKNGVLVAAP